jgi:hypothetical protein
MIAKLNVWNRRIENPCVGGSIPHQATIKTLKGKGKLAIKKMAGFFHVCCL